MAQEAELREKLKRMAAALAAMEEALARPAPEDRTQELAQTRAELDEALGRVAELEAAQVEPVDAPVDAAGAGAAEVARLRGALEQLSVANAQLRDQAEGAADASLKAELDAMRAAREMDLSEMKALLAELEPMLESA